ncbi:transcriptional regulator [Frondihabitans sucicola]|uniref:Transcriptional regulator n=2 Tax=Frondihabitans sucicola TaxID=1268041 RepID=A0ABM8GLS7_9MICO|nr:transcriptional regulator [Frondihabitans sucicola]
MVWLETQQTSPREMSSRVILNRMLELLLSGDLAPGARIPSERQLAEELQVGRGMIREAIKSLSMLGLLDQRVGDGTFLQSSSSELLPKVIEWGLLLGERRLEDLLEARSILEVQLVGLAAERRTPAELEAIQAHAAVMRTPDVAVDDYVAADIAFHLDIARASHNAVLSGVLENIRSLLEVWVSRVIHTAGETESSLAMHEPILAAIEASDAEAAVAAMSAHMERATRRLHASLPSAG